MKYMTQETTATETFSFTVAQHIIDRYREYFLEYKDLGALECEIRMIQRHGDPFLAEHKYALGQFKAWEKRLKQHPQPENGMD